MTTPTDGIGASGPAGPAPGATVDDDAATEPDPPDPPPVTPDAASPAGSEAAAADAAHPPAESTSVAEPDPPAPVQPAGAAETSAEPTSVAEPDEALGPTPGEATPPGADSGDGGGPAAAEEATPGRRRWPASKRARAAARRRARALAAAERASTPAPARSRPWRRLALGRSNPPAARRGPPERVRRQRAWVLTGIAVTTAVGVGLAALGLSVVRNSTAGRYVDPPVRPDQPGYQAYVASTPTLAVVHHTPQGRLAGATLLSLRPGDGGGGVIFVPPSTRTPGAERGDGGGQGLTVAAAYDGGGADAVRATMSDILNVSVDDVVEVDDSRWASLVGPVAPVTVTLERPVGRWPAGEVALGAADVGDFLAARPPDETELDRTARQATFWTAWLAMVEEGGRTAVPGEIDSGIGRFVRGVARDPSPAVLPVNPVGGGTTFRPDEDRIAELVTDAVPYPLSPAAGRRVRVRLLNGTSDPDLTPAAARQLVEAGAEITIAGNADSFRVEETTFTYRSSDERDDARRLADAFGVGRVERTDREPGSTASTAGDEAGDEIDVTIVLGSDAQDLIGRLEDPG